VKASGSKSIAMDSRLSFLSIFLSPQCDHIFIILVIKILEFCSRDGTISKEEEFRNANVEIEK